MEAMQQLVDLFQYMEHTAGLHITLGGLALPEELLRENVLLPFIWHVNPFCLFIKSSPHRWSQCVCAKNVLMRTLQYVKVPVSGYCPFGVWEKTWPIFLSDRVVGSVSASACQGEMDHVRMLWGQSLPREDHAKAAALYEQHLVHRSDPLKAAECVCQMVSTHLSQMAMLGEISFSAKSNPSDQLIQRAMDYLRIHLHEPISVGDVARFCSVSESCLQHLFRKIRHQGIVQTLTALRMDKAVHILVHSDLSVAETAAVCGFADPNYFSLVFSKQTGVSPRQYRMRHAHR